MNPLIKVWFWLLILSIIGFIISLFLFERFGQTNTRDSSTEWWIWVILILSVVIWTIALILYILDVVDYNNHMELLEACGELPPPPPKKKIECLEEKCRVLRKCNEKPVVKTCNDVNIITSTPQTSNVIAVNQDIQPPWQEIITDQDQSFSATGLRPLNSLAPSSTRIITNPAAVVVPA